MSSFLQYIKELYSYGRGRLVLTILLMVMAGFLEGIGVFLLVPLLGLAGILPGEYSSNAVLDASSQFFHITGISASIVTVLAVYFVVICGQSIMLRYQSITSAGIQYGFSTYLSRRLFKAIAFAKWQFFLSKVRSDITHVLTHEINRVGVGTKLFLLTLATAFTTTIQLILAFIISPGLTLLISGTGAIFFIFLYPYVKKSKNMGVAISDNTRKLQFEIDEHLKGLKEIKSCGLETSQYKRFGSLKEDIESNNMHFVRIQSRTDMFYRITASVVLIIFFFFAIKVFMLDPQSFVLVVIIFSKLWPKLSVLQNGLQNIAIMLPAFQNIKQLEVESANATEQIADTPSERISLTSGIDFKNVSFSYTGARSSDALKEVNFFIKSGTTVAFTGSSGSGKTTCADIIMGLLSPTSGEVLVDGVPIADSLYAWRKSIGYVPQEPFMFHASIRENMMWFCPDATEDDMWRALKVAAVDKFVRELPDGVDTVVGDRGVLLSGGERQRIVLARALLMNPSVLILDEATSSLDAENELRIQESLESLHGKMTIIIIAHRVSTIKNADMIYVLDNGKIVESGNYQSLSSAPSSRFYSLTQVTGEQS